MYRKILVPLDGSAIAECALSHLESLVQKVPLEEIFLLRVVVNKLPFYSPECVSMANYMYCTWRDNILEEARKYLSTVQSRLISKGITVQTIVLENNNPAECITNFSHDSDVDLIIMATHGYTGIKEFMLGSVALNVLHLSRLPVLLIRPDTCDRERNQ